MKYAIVVSKAGSNYSAHAPDAPGCVAAGETLEETIQLMKESLEFHFEGMMEYGEPIPEPISQCFYVEPRIPQQHRAVSSL